MKLYSLLLAFLFSLLTSVANSQNTLQALHVMTYNLRYDNPADGQDAWKERRAEVGSFLMGKGLYASCEAPDILGVQEALSSQLQFLDIVMQGYSRYSRGRDDGQSAGEHAAIYWRTDRFSLLDSGTFWLSEQPNFPNKGWDAALPRIASWVKLKENKKIFLVLNTHFDHIGVKARAESARQLAAWVRQQAQPVIVMGDFNCEVHEQPLKILREGGLTETRPSLDTTPTFNGFTWPKARHKLIDFILTRGFITHSYHVIQPKRSNGRQLSDHYPVEARLLWP